jgi:hypothetical protein
MTVFGSVRVPRLAYDGRGMSDVHPSDATLNLPREKHSHGVRKVACEEAALVSYDEAVKSINRHTGARAAKRQLQELLARGAQDFDAFYESGIGVAQPSKSASLLILSVDAKGIVVRVDDLREETRRAAQASKHKLKGRLSGGEKRNRKRMATVGAVYDVEPLCRSPEDVLRDLRPVRDSAKPRPRAENKRVWACIEKEPEVVTRDIFDEAQRRDPSRSRKWVILVDGDIHQIKRVKAEAAKRAVEVTVVLDLIHVLEYLWKAAWCFFEQGDQQAEKWVAERALSILSGNSSDVAAGIRRTCTLRHLSQKERLRADKCADYLIAKRSLLHYDDYLSAGFPISTGVVEGACRHLINDRLDITGARWSVAGAEAVLRLRSLRSSGDFDAYWNFHLGQELERNHLSRFADSHQPVAA